MKRNLSPSSRGFGFPSKTQPEWNPPWFVYSDGISFQRTGSLTGGGMVPVRMPVGRFKPLVANYATRTASLVGGGIVPANPATLAPLLPGPGSRSTIG